MIVDYQMQAFIPTLDVNGTVIYCLHGEVQSNIVNVQVTTGCEFAMHMFASIIFTVLC